MKKRTLILTAVIAALFALAGCSDIGMDLARDTLLSEYGLSNDEVLDLTVSSIEESDARYASLGPIELVTLKGLVNHFGMDVSVDPPEYLDWDAFVPGVSVWVAEYPNSRNLAITSDSTGWWTMYVLKYRDQDVDFSFVYEKEGWITTKSNIIAVGGADDADLAIQFIDPNYYNYAVKPMVEDMISPLSLDSAMIVTVGKSWASMHHRQIHGASGATVNSDSIEGESPMVGPVYFNEGAQPDPTRMSTSADGGVCWINIPTDTYTITAEGGEFEYSSVKFSVTEDDADAGVVLYIATPPDCILSTDDSGYVEGGV